MRVLAIDLGEVRTGVAICDSAEILASPLCVIEERDQENLVLRLSGLISEYHVQTVVVGLPVNMDGSEGTRAALARDFGSKLSSVAGVEIVFIDERWSTKSAQWYLNLGTTRPRNKKKVIDEVAATIILQQYLDSKKV